MSNMDDLLRNTLAEIDGDVAPKHMKRTSEETTTFERLDKDKPTKKAKAKLDETIDMMLLRKEGKKKRKKIRNRRRLIIIRLANLKMNRTQTRGRRSIGRLSHVTDHTMVGGLPTATTKTPLTIAVATTMVMVANTEAIAVAMAEGEGQDTEVTIGFIKKR